MTDDAGTPSRRQFLKAGLAGTALGASGCLRLSQGGEESTPDSTETPVDLTSAQFEFHYDPASDEVTITYNGGVNLTSRNLQIRHSDGKQVMWAALGSTAEATDEQLTTGATATIGPNIRNWNQPVGPTATIRLVYTGKDTSTTLGRFTPTESMSLTTTIPKPTAEQPRTTRTTTPSESTTETPQDPPTVETRTPSKVPTPRSPTSETPTETPSTTETPTPTPSGTDSTIITGFSISNPSGQQLRVSFDADAQLSDIEIEIDGQATATLSTDQFRQITQPNAYTYEATYDPQSDGTYTATLQRAADRSGNDGANGQSVSLTVDTTPPTISDYNALNPSQRDIQITLTSNEQLHSAQLSLSGPESVTLKRSDLSEQQVDDTYTYRTTYTVGRDGQYTVELVSAKDKRGNDGATDQAATLSISPSVTEQWTVDVGGPVISGPTVADDTLYCASPTDALSAIDRGAGSELWMVKLDGVHGDPAVVDGTLYIGDLEGVLYAIDATDGSEKWRFEVGESIFSSPAVADGTVYFGAYDTTVYAIDAATGSQEWSYETNGRIASSPAVSDDTIYIGSNDQRIHAIDVATGSRIWAFQTDDHVVSSPTVSNGTVYCGSSDNNVYAIDAETSEQKWVYETGGSVKASPAVDSGMVYCGSLDSNMYALSAKTGTQEWVFETDDEIKRYSTPTVTEDTVYFGSEDAHYYAVSASTGTEKWRFDVDDYATSKPAVLNDTIYAGSGTGKLHALSESY